MSSPHAEPDPSSGNDLGYIVNPIDNSKELFDNKLFEIDSLATYADKVFTLIQSCVYVFPPWARHLH
jgi:hypothetical protein